MKDSVRQQPRMAMLRLMLMLGVSISGINPVCAQLSQDEQHRIQWIRPEAVSRFAAPPSPAPVTVAGDNVQQFERLLPLDEAIRIALHNADVIRVLTGVSASPSGRTIYDPAIATTSIDQAVGRFDPVFAANSTFRHTETPVAVPVADPTRAAIGDIPVGGTDLSASLSKTNRLGGLGQLRALDTWNQRGAGLLDPAHAPSIELSYTQPLLRGGGRAANEAPIVIAGLQQDQSYFQLKGSVQELVRGVIAAYWQLVQARTELWAREIQVEQAKAAFDRAEAQFRVELGDQATLAQPKLAYANFRASLVSARASVLQREAALRNLLGLPPEDGQRLVPSTAPTREQISFQWEELVHTAQTRRPDLIELNLILMADQQRLIQGKNLARPELNAVAVQRWNGLSGRLIDGTRLSTPLDRHTDWTLGLTFSVPVGLRQARAQMRSNELLIARDRANIHQSLHQLQHTLATSIRSIDQNYLQYEAYRETRQAARENLEVQVERERAGLTIFLNVLQGITDWGNAVASESLSLTTYNTELATLESATGTILETHGISFSEELYTSVSPWGLHFEDDCYPLDLKPTDNAKRYEDSGEASERSFNLEDYPKRRSDVHRLKLPQTPTDNARPYDSRPEEGQPGNAQPENGPPGGSSLPGEGTSSTSDGSATLRTETRQEPQSGAAGRIRTLFQPLSPAKLFRSAAWRRN
ncbi:MAG: TolC family protein [Planctomycetaceae bacterium]|nr:TolC family protein [Planctomycetaceae bacterium]